EAYACVGIGGAEHGGVGTYALPAREVGRRDTLRGPAQTSMLKPRPAKPRSSVTAMAARHKAEAVTGSETRVCYEARRQRQGRKDLVARFGGIPLRQDRRAVITDPAPVPIWPPRRELIYRLRRRWCELCEQGATVAVHQIAA